MLPNFYHFFSLRYCTKINSLDSYYDEFIYETTNNTKQDTTSKIYDINHKLVIRKEVTEMGHAETRG